VIARFRAHHPRLAELMPGEPTGHVKLSGAQWVIAREDGFASWSSLKTDIEQETGRRPGVVPYSLVIWNDDTTPMEFVVLLLKQVFGKSEQDAVRVMLDTHYREFAVCAALDQLEEPKLTAPRPTDPGASARARARAHLRAPRCHTGVAERCMKAA
jgi:ATP-dependent Clp protease adaptor protein ClpS